MLPNRQDNKPFPWKLSVDDEVIMNGAPRITAMMNQQLQDIQRHIKEIKKQEKKNSSSQ